MDKVKKLMKRSGWYNYDSVHLMVPLANQRHSEQVLGRATLRLQVPRTRQRVLSRGKWYVMLDRWGYSHSSVRALTSGDYSGLSVLPSD